MAVQKDTISRILPYVIVFFSFVVVVILLVLSIDSLLLPALIHNRDTVKIPNVTTISLDEAEKILKQNDLAIYKVMEQYHDQFKSGIVISQMPKPGQVVKTGRSVYLTVSKGQETIIVPYLIGQPTRTARIILKNKGLEIGSIEYASSDIYGPDTVIQQKVPSGYNVQFGRQIDLVISKGSESQVKVPQIIGLGYDEAVRILTESGLQVGNVSTIRSETYQSNTVLNQSTNASELINKNSMVHLTISK